MKKYSSGDICPTCGNVLEYDDGTPETRDDPGTPPEIYCDECGEIFDVDWNKEFNGRYGNDSGDPDENY